MTKKKTNKKPTLTIYKIKELLCPMSSQNLFCGAQLHRKELEHCSLSLISCSCRKKNVCYRLICCLNDNLHNSYFRQLNNSATKHGLQFPRLLILYWCHITHPRDCQSLNIIRTIVLANVIYPYGFILL